MYKNFVKKKLYVAEIRVVCVICIFVQTFQRFHSYYGF